MRRIALGLAMAVLLAAMPAITLAAEPNNQACLGHDFSTYARYGSAAGYDQFAAGSGFGQFVAGLAQFVPGLGIPIQYHLAGYISDATIVNSCNN